MLRTLNFTGRKKIPREAARISLRREAERAVAFDAELHLTGFDFPPGSQVFIEAFFKTASERFAWGTVSEIAAPQERRLRRLAQPELASFRVKIVEPANGGVSRLLAVADHIAPEGLRGGEKRRIALFRVNVTDELQDRVWRLDFDLGGPILELNRGVAGIKERVRDEAFMALVFPAVIQGVYQQIFQDGCYDAEDDRDGWQARWLRFGRHLAGRGVEQPAEDEPGEEQETWVDDVIGGWSRRENIVQKYHRAFAGGERGYK
jgi:hypothetical protein